MRKPPIHNPYRPKKFRDMAFKPSTPSDTMVGALVACLAVVVLWVVVLV